MKKLFSLFAAMFAALALNAAVINIDNTTPDALRLALNSANNFDEIVMAAGTYVESNSNYIAIDGKEVFIKAAEGAEVIIQPQVPITISNGGVATFENVKIDASRLTELADWYEHLIYAADGAINGLKLKGCEIYGFALNKSMIYCSSTNKFAGITIENCYIHDVEKSVLFIENTAKTMSAQIKNSTFENIIAHVTDSYWAGIIDIRATEALVTFDHCTFYNVIPMNTDYSAVSKVTLVDGTVSNCIFMLPTAQDGIRAMRGVAATNCITYNYLKDSGTGIHSSVTQTNCVQVDPLFVDAANGDYTLGENSPALTMNDGAPIGDPRWVPAEEEVKYYAKNNWGGVSDWTWKEMTKEEDEYHLMGVFGGTGVNVNDKADDANALWFPLYMITALATDSTPAELGALDSALFVFNPADSTMTAYILDKYIEPEPQVGGIVYNWAKEAADQIGTTTLGGNSNISISTVKIHSNTDQVDGVKFGSSYVYAEGKYISIRPAEGAFKAGDTIKTSVVFNNSDATKYCMLDIYAADTQTRLFRSDSASTLNGQNAGDPAIQEYILASDQDSLLLGRYGNTGMFITLLQVVRPGVAPEPKHTYTVAGSSAAVFGTTWDPANTANDMAEVEPGIYMFAKENITLAAGEIAFKVCEDHAWTNSWPASDYKLAIDSAGIYNIVINFNVDTKEVTAQAVKTADAEILPMIVLHGNFSGNWADTEEFAAAEDKLTASLKMNLTAGTYEFGMKFDGNWKANGAQLTREAAQTSLLEGNGNMKVTADVDGEYIFTYTFLGEQLAVTYPAKPAAAPTTAPAAPTVAEDDVMAIYCEHYATNNLHFEVLGWGGVRTWKSDTIDGTVLLYCQDMQWEIMTNWGAPSYDLSAYKKLHADIWVPAAAKTKLTFEALGTSDGGSGAKPSAAFDLAEGWNAIDAELTQWANYDFKDMKYFIFEGYQTPAGESFEGNPFAFTNVYFYDKAPEGITNTAVDAKAVKSLENGILVIRKNGKVYTVTGLEIK